MYLLFRESLIHLSASFELLPRYVCIIRMSAVRGKYNKKRKPREQHLNRLDFQRKFILILFNDTTIPFFEQNGIRATVTFYFVIIIFFLSFIAVIVFNSF